MSFSDGPSLLDRCRMIGRKRTDWRSWGIVCSLLVHLLVALAIILGLPQLMQPAPPPTVEPVSVDLVSEQGGASRAAAAMGPVARTEQASPDPVKEKPRPIAPVAAAVAATPHRRPEPVQSPVRPARPRPPRSPAPALFDPQNGQIPQGLAVNDGNGGAGHRSSISAKDFLRAQIERHLNFDVSALRNADFVVSIHVLLDRDGSVRQADIVDSPRYAVDPLFHAAADSTRRAVLVASPLQLPPGQFDAFHDVTLDFSPREVSR
ncbi:hypothetical protein [Telmatospirillum sp.]|uniref:hypothetical protein n=1 Tax=Telmatospirillum sp. TaxID=2079197 RepID=UPI00284E99AE|nr:hypothetical protein [Telmatospirillum sp.]MDR3439668.1 hypothetical protein [Telmatospirillum sp.]